MTKTIGLGYSVTSKRATRSLIKSSLMRPDAMLPTSAEDCTGVKWENEICHRLSWFQGLQNCSSSSSSSSRLASVASRRWVMKPTGQKRTQAVQQSTLASWRAGHRHQLRVCKLASVFGASATAYNECCTIAGRRWCNILRFCCVTLFLLGSLPTVTHLFVIVFRRAWSYWDHGANWQNSAEMKSEFRRTSLFLHIVLSSVLLNGDSLVS